MAKNNQPIEKPESYYIKGLQDGTIRVSSLPKETILDIVEVLFSEGSSTVQIAQLLGRNDRSIRRYLEAIRTRNAVEPSAQRAKEIVGELIQKANSSYSTLRRLAQSKEGSVGDKTQAEFAAWRVYKELTNTLQTLGYLPQRPQQVVGDLFCHIDEQGLEKSFQGARKALADVIDVAQQCGTLTPELEENVKALQQKVEKAEIVQEVEKLSKESNKLQEESHD